jgi:predicted MPP superfamily phosphohydrolase
VHGGPAVERLDGRLGPVSSRPRRFGRARHLTLRRRLAEIWYDVAYRGAWPARLARLLGLQGRCDVATHTLPLSGRRRTAPPIRIAFASDLHAGPATYPGLIAEACRALADARPDLLLLGGDFVSFHARHVDCLVPLLVAVHAPLGKFAVLGNHDLLADDAYIVRRLGDAGVRVLVNSNARLPAPHDDVWICGLDNTEEGAPDAEAAFAGADGIRLVLMHSPDGLRAVGDRSFAAAFCGHTHGGQFWIGERPLVSFSGPLSRKYLRGGVFHLGADSGGVLLVSRGIGCGNLPMRKGADPEVHVCTLR